MIRANAFLPELSHVDEDGKFPVFSTLDGRIGCLFECPILDLESLDVENRSAALDRLVSALPDGFVLRCVHRAAGASDLEGASFRSQAIEALGYVSRRVLLSIEKAGADPISFRSAMHRLRGRRSGALGAEIERLRRVLPEHELNQLGAVPLTAEEIRTEFQAPSDMVGKLRDAIDLGSKLTGVVRVYKPGTRPIGDGTLSSILDELPMPFEVVVTITKVPKSRADFRLRSQLARGQTISDPTSGARQAATEKALAETSLHGVGLCEVEWLVTISRQSEGELRGDLEKARSILSGFGEAMIETIGAIPSFVASRIGAKPHFLFLEEDAATSFYLPVFGFGEHLKKGKGPARMLLLHRLDGSLHAYDHFSPRFLAYNAIICGKTGSGKSVLANALSSGLMQDPQTRMIKIDVGGSYKKECEAFGGTEINFRLDAPSGVNPFRVFSRIASSNEAIEIVSEFLATLVREEDEKQIPKALRAQIEEGLKRYTAHLKTLKEPRPSIDEFLAQAGDIPRKSLMARWATGGVFENALKETPSTASGGEAARYRYFNFENIHAASSRDFAEGVMAAVITMTNLEMLRMGDRSKGQAGERLVLFCDETKFFIEKFAQFFLLTAANFRKYGHGLVFMLQNIRNAELRLPDGSIDRGLILNSPIRFFLQADTETEYLREQFQFGEHHLRVVVTHPYRGREYREAVLQDDTGTRVVRLYLTDEEYWRMTSTKEDVDKFNRLRAVVPELSIEEAIRCLAVGYGR